MRFVSPLDGIGCERAIGKARRPDGKADMEDIHGGGGRQAIESHARQRRARIARRADNEPGARCHAAANGDHNARRQHQHQHDSIITESQKIES